MAALDRVPGPRSPLGGWTGRALAFVALGIALAIAKPWGDGGLRPAWSPRATEAADPLAGPTDPTRTHDPAAYDPAPPAADWALITTEGRVALPFLGRAAAAGGDGTGTTVDEVVSGPVVAIGVDEPVLSIGLAHPPDRAILTARLWSLGGPDPPSRLELAPVRSPWAVPHVAMLARPGPGGDDAVVAWTAGLYRLDVLLGPDRVTRSVMLTVGNGGSMATGTDPSPDPDATRTPRHGARAAGAPDDRDGAALLQRVAILPEKVTVWTAGRIVAGWNRAPARRCSLSEIWEARDLLAACWPVPLGEIDALGVHLAGSSVASIGLHRLDPLPGPVATASGTGIGGKAGLALVRAPEGGLPDGIYRLEARLTTGRVLGWYVEVGPLGRAVARVHEASASR